MYWIKGLHTIIVVMYTSGCITLGSLIIAQIHSYVIIGNGMK